MLHFAIFPLTCSFLTNISSDNIIIIRESEQALVQSALPPILSYSVHLPAQGSEQLCK